MSYDYSVGFLARNSDLVQGLIALSKTEEIRQFRNTDPAALQTTRLKVSNVLASLAHNYPEYADIRRRIRTWITYENGEWVLNIGHAKHKALGRPPKGQTNVDWVTPALTHQATQAGTHYQHEEVVRAIPSYERLVGRVLELPDTVRSVRAEFAQPLENLDPFTEVFTAWTVGVDGPTTLTLER